MVIDSKVISKEKYRRAAHIQHIYTQFLGDIFQIWYSQQNIGETGSVPVVRWECDREYAFNRNQLNRYRQCVPPEDRNGFSSRKFVFCSYGLADDGQISETKES
jgi:hypothetical protein